MLRKSVFAIAAAASSLIAAPAFAQDRDVEEIAREDFQCVVWLSVLSGSISGGDETARTGLNVAIGYFVGHYEALTGRNINQNWDREAAEQVALNLDSFGEACAARMEALGGRLQTLGDSMANYAEGGRGK
ncbi:hypothetical protein [Aurantiacibacter sp. MUD61]|uniref:hypothetical protein n=1 Tax=Aurantiacibacter sp. MUD61 TaxID=3009083 RepID=UPI0022F08A6F|nr:hypothetical protein [Aurantiacibacter sp. MUD61]